MNFTDVITYSIYLSNGIGFFFSGEEKMPEPAIKHGRSSSLALVDNQPFQYAPLGGPNNLYKDKEYTGTQPSITPSTSLALQWNFRVATSFKQIPNLK